MVTNTKQPHIPFLFITDFPSIFFPTTFFHVCFFNHMGNNQIIETVHTNYTKLPHRALNPHVQFSGEFVLHCCTHRIWANNHTHFCHGWIWAPPRENCGQALFCLLFHLDALTIQFPLAPTCAFSSSNCNSFLAHGGPLICQLLEYCAHGQLMGVRLVGHFDHCTACFASCHELHQCKSAANVIKRPLLVRWSLLSPDPRDPLVISCVAAHRVSLAVWSSAPLGSRLSAVLLSWAEVDSTPPCVSWPRRRHNTVLVSRLAPRHDGIRCRRDLVCCAPATLQHCALQSWLSTQLNLGALASITADPWDKSFPRYTLSEFLTISHQKWRNVGEPAWHWHPKLPTHCTSPHGKQKRQWGKTR